jgi:hypothetical protein
MIQAHRIDAMLPFAMIHYTFSWRKGVQLIHRRKKKKKDKTK